MRPYAILEQFPGNAGVSPNAAYFLLERIKLAIFGHYDGFSSWDHRRPAGKGPPLIYRGVNSFAEPPRRRRSQEEKSHPLCSKCKKYAALGETAALPGEKSGQVFVRTMPS